MEFEIKIIITNEYFNGNFKFDLNGLENYISDNLKEFEFGDSVVKFFWGFELFKFNGGFAQFFSNDIESWKHSRKWLVANSHFDWNVIKDMNDSEIFEQIKVEMVSSIERIGKMKRKPKNFDYLSFREKVTEILEEYKKYSL